MLGSRLGQSVVVGGLAIMGRPWPWEQGRWCGEGGGRGGNNKKRRITSMDTLAEWSKALAPGASP